MRRPTPIPASLVGRAFDLAEARRAGVSARMLEHPRFTRLHRGVYVVTDTVLDPSVRVQASLLATPDHAVISHQSRFVALGLRIGGPEVHLSTSGDLHLDLDGVVLHRTRFSLRAVDRLVEVETAVIGAATSLTFVDLVAAIDWLAHRSYLDLARLRRRVAQEPRRPGVATVRRALTYVDPRSRSVPESRTRLFVVLAGLPRPESNLDVHDGHGRFLFCGDLVYRWLRLVLEYEGRQHALDPAQFRRDIERYAGARAAGWDYVQVTADKLSRPRACVLEIHAAMRRRGYDGPAPMFGREWSRALRQPGR